LHVECKGSWIFKSCRATETLALVVAVDFRKLKDGSSFGVVTAFCDGHLPTCPDWVKNSINI